jgi:hypothetical protein
MFVTIDNTSYVKWENSGQDYDKYASFFKFSKKKNEYITSKNTNKLSHKYVKASIVGENSDLITNIINSKHNYISYKTGIKPIENWTNFKFTEKDPYILSLLITDSYVEDNDVWVPIFWCWYNLSDKFHNLTLLKINDENCVELGDWVRNTPILNKRFRLNCYDFFEHDDGPGVSDVEIVNDDIYVKLLYVFKYKY